MPAPSNRVPVRIARGTKANLDADISSLREGEICYANDEDSLYVVEGGALVSAGATGALNLNELSDVDIATTAPTAGQALVYNATASEWQPGNVATEGSASELNDLTNVDTNAGTGDSSWDNVVFLFNGESGSANGTTFEDLSSVGAGNGTVYGDAGDVSTVAAAAKFGSYGVSGTQNPAQEYGISYPFNSAYDLGSNDFTIEFFFQAPTSADRGGSIIGVSSDGTADKYCWAVSMDTAGELQFSYSPDGTFGASLDHSFSDEPTSTGVWHHYAVVRGGLGDLNFNATAVVPFPTETEAPDGVSATVETVTGNGSGATVLIYTDANGNLDFLDSYTSGIGYQIGDQVTVNEVGGSGQFTATVSANDLRCYYNGVASSSYQTIDGSPLAGDTDNQLLFMGGNGYSGNLFGACEGYFDEVRVTNGTARYTADFTPPTASFPTSAAGGPQDGQALVYNASSDQWEAGTVAAGGGGSTTLIAPFAFGYIDSVNSGTGVGVSWGTFNTSTGIVQVTFDTPQADTSYIVTTDCEKWDDHGADVNSKTTTGFTLYLYTLADGEAISDPSTLPHVFQVYTNSGTQTISGVGGGGSGATSINGLTDVDTSTVPPTDGQALVWDNTAGQWEPGTVGGGGGATTIDGLTDVDTSTVAPTDGQALVWDDANSQWEPGATTSNTEWTLTANGSTDYVFAGTGFAGTETDPTVYVVRGQTYKFTNAMGAHPFQIQSTQGTSGTIYSDGITNNGVSNGTLTWEVRMDAPSILYYQCTSHALMAGTIYVLDEGSGGGATTIDGLTDVDTTSVAPTDGQVLVWDNIAGQWEPGSIRTLLGIGEYVDDAAAGTGGVASGALYYNTTNSNYVLKT